MYERTYGYLYEPNQDIKETAKSIRRIIKTLTKGGMLPNDWKYSVRIQRFSMGQSINVTAETERAIYAAEPDTYDFPLVLNVETGKHVTAYKDRLTIEAVTVEETLRDLVAAHNHNGSDVMTDYFDVKFYGNVSIKGPGHYGNKPLILEAVA